MNERIKKVTTVVKDKWSGFSRAVRILICAIPVVIIAIIIILSVMLNQKDDEALFTGLTTTEASEISRVITDLGVTDVTLKSNGEIRVPSDQVDYLRMQLAVQGYPKSSDNYDIWNNGVDLWSTDSDKREIQRQQREQRIAASIATLDAVRTATVIFDPGTTSDYLLASDKQEPSCSITLRLADDMELKNSEVRAIFALVTSSVSGMTNDNVKIVDTQGREYRWISEEEEANGERDASGTLVAAKRLAFENSVQQAAMSRLKDFFDTAFGNGNYSVIVNTRLNYDSKQMTDEHYYTDADDNKGITKHEDHVREGIDMGEEGNIVGVTPNGDLSPDYPTLADIEDGESFYYGKDEIEYDVSKLVTVIEKDGYEIENLSASLILNTNTLTIAEREAYSDLLAKAVGTTIDNVSVFNTVFPLPGGGGSTSDNRTPIYINGQDGYRNLLLYVVIVLGVLLILLLILSLFMSKSRKRKIRRRQEAALAAAAGGGALGLTAQEPQVPEEVDFNIASLTEEAGKESKETILKREIAEFSQNSPEIVAMIIKNLLREE
ncbi:MAG: hypothetical protein K2O14_00755 [Oscillospiraceae bacterium]|nr:hypothetical protein [Oscillospiraceae bacterium]